MIEDSQLVAYAGYRTSEGGVLGDPVSVPLTERAVRLGWRPPEPAGRFDVLPLVVSGPDGQAQVHEVPEDAPYEYGRAPAAMLARARELAALAERHGATLPDLAVQYPLRHPAVRSVALGMRTAAQVRSNLARMEAPVPEAAWAQIAQLEREASAEGSPA